MRPCLEPGCPTLTDRTRCTAHERDRDRRRQAARPGYGGDYPRNRSQVLAGDPPCYAPGCAAPATTADHIVPLRDGGSHALHNLRPSCPRHNSGRRD